MEYIKNLDEFLGDGMTLNQRMSLNEMSQVNFNEKGLEKNCNFNSDVYYVYVKGEGGYKKFPHYHIRHKSEKWDIRMNLEGSFHSIKTKGANRRTKDDFKDIEKISIEWAKMPNALDPQKTNSEVAKDLWIRSNS